MKQWAPVEVEFYKERYAAAGKGSYDIYVVFVEKGLSLLNDRGLFGMILPHKFFNAKYGERLRHLLTEGGHLSHVVHFGDHQIFRGGTTYTCLLFLERAGTQQCEVTKVDDLTAWRATGSGTTGTILAEKITPDEWNFVVGSGAKLFEKLNAMHLKLGGVASRIYQGLITGADTVYLFKEFRPAQAKGLTEVFSQELKQWTALESHILKQVVRSGSIHRYRAQSGACTLFPYQVKDGSARLLCPNEMHRDFPRAWDYLNCNKTCLQSRERGRFRDSQWYRFGRSQNLGMWERSKLMISYMVTQLATYLDQSDNYYFVNVTTGGYGVTSDGSFGSLAYLCGLLNSRLLDFYLKQVSTTFHGGYIAANKQYIERIPIQPINPADQARHDQMVELVHRMLSLHKQLAAARTAHDKTVLQRQIDATDRQIDQLVYELYGLTDEEIAIVEETANA